MKDTSSPSTLMWVLLALFFGLLLASCTKVNHVERDAFVMQLTPSHGKCLYWEKIEDEVGYTSCSERRRINGYDVICTRKMGHRGGHHMHGSVDCFWVW